MDLPIGLKRCDVNLAGDLDPGRSIPVVPKSHDDVLTEKELVDYKSQRVKFLSWLLNFGKSPDKGQGYSEYTIYSDAYRTAKFDKWVWIEGNGYRYPPDKGDADEFLEHLAYSDEGEVEKGKLQEGIQHLGKWLHHERGRDKWEFDFRFDGSGGNHQPQDFLTQDERRAIRQAALHHGDIPSYSSLTPAERSGWKRHVANVLGKPYEDVTVDDWEKIDGWKVPSLVWVSLDAGLRPDEVSNVRESWIDTDNAVLRIPKQESSKNVGNWTVSLTERTATAVDRWKDERQLYDRYTNSHLLWLTSHGNPYGSNSLRRLLHKLCDEAGIETANRSMSWYTIRHSVGTLMTKERDLAATKSQLRHKAPKTTMKYDQVPVEDRRDALDNMG